MNQIKITPCDANKARWLKARVEELKRVRNAICGLSPLTVIDGERVSLSAYGQATKSARDFISAEINQLEAEYEALLSEYE